MGFNPSEWYAVAKGVLGGKWSDTHTGNVFNFLRVFDLLEWRVDPED